MFSFFSQLPGSWRNLLLLFSFSLLSNLLVAQGMQLWYSQPASVWNEALPLGNGRLAAMLFGGTSTERVQLNEETVWSGEPGNILKAATGINSNPFFQTAAIKTPLIADPSKIDKITLKPVHEYDFVTRVNGTYLLQLQ